MRRAHEGFGPRAVRRRQRQPARTGAHERDDGVGRDPARGGDRGDPAPDAARLDPRAGSSRCCSARTPRACGTSSRSPATRRSGRLSGHRLGLRRRRDRPRRADDAAERGRRLPRPRDRRADVVLPRRRGQPDGGRPRARGATVPAEGRGGRAVRDDADRSSTSTYLESFLERIGGSPIPLLVGVWPIRFATELAVRVHNETPGHRRPRARAGALPRRRARRRRGRRRARARTDRGRARAGGGVYVVAPFRRPLGVLDLLER